MVKKISIFVIMLIAFIALLQGNVLAAESLPKAVDGVITLTEDVILNETVFITDTVTLDLNGHTIKNETDIWEVASESDIALIYVDKGGNLTINGNGTLAAKENDCYTIAVRSGGVLTINGGKYVGNCSAIYIATEGTVNVNGGEFSIQQLATSGNEYQETLNCKDAYYTAGTAKFIVKGGRYYKYNPTDAAEPNAPQSYVAEGYKVVQDGDYYEVVIDNEYNFLKALAAGGTVTLTEDILLTKTVFITDTVTLNLNGHTIKNETDIWQVASESDIALIYVDKGGNLTINGNGTLAAKENDCYTIAVRSGGVLTINGGKYVGNCSAIYIATEGTVNVNGGEFSIQQLATSGNEYQETLNCKDAYYTAGTAKFIVKGGRYYKYNPTDAAEPNAPQSYVPAEYKVVKDGEWYEVVCAHIKCTENEEKLPTYAEEGTKAYYVCDLCSKWFEDKGATVEITDKTSIIVPKLVEVAGTNATVTEDAIDKEIAIAVDADIDVVVIPLGSIGTTVTAATIPVSSLEDIVDANKALTIETSEVTATIDEKALEEIIKQAGNNETIKIEIIEVEETTLNEKQKEALKDKEVSAIISAEIIANGKVISDFGGGKVKLEIPFTPEKDAKGTDYKVIYIADDGSIEEITTEYVDGFLVIELEHFSEYGIIKNLVDTKPDDSDDEDAKTDDSDDEGTKPDDDSNKETVKDQVSKEETSNNIVKTGDNIFTYIVVLLLAVLGIVVISRKNIKN